MRAKIRFGDDYNQKDIYEICEKYDGAVLWYSKQEIRFNGDNDTLDELIDEINSKYKPIKIRRY